MRFEIFGGELVFEISGYSFAYYMFFMHYSKKSSFDNEAFRVIFGYGES